MSRDVENFVQGTSLPLFGDHFWKVSGEKLEMEWRHFDIPERVCLWFPRQTDGDQPAGRDFVSSFFSQKLLENFPTIPSDAPAGRGV